MINSRHLNGNPILSDPAHTALYLYGVVPSVGTDGEPLVLTARGLDGASVNVVTYRDVGILMHACAPLPYQGDVEHIHAWVLAHHEVVSAAHSAAGTILPMRFNSIAAAADRPVADILVDWLDRSHDVLAARLAVLRDRVELGVQVLAERTPRDPSAGPGAATANSTSRGRGYFQEQLAERQEKERLRAAEALTARTVFDELAAHCDEIVVNSKRPLLQDSSGTGTKQTVVPVLLDAALLAHSDKVGAIGRYLADVAAAPGLTVRFTGPWAPYTFSGAFDMPLLIPATSDPATDKEAHNDA